MKAVIADLRDGQAAALCEDGRVIKLADAGYTLGQIVEVHERKRPARRWKRVIASVAAAAVLLMGVGGGAAYAMPYGVVSLDANPAIEYTINRFDYVLSVEGVNEDGKAMLAGMDSSQLVHRRIGDAVEAAVAQLEAGDWLESGEILISAGTKAEAHSEKLLDELETGLRCRRENLQVCALAVSKEEIDEAHREGMSAGRRRMLRELGEREGESFDAEDWADRPIGEILRELDPERGQTSGQGPRAARNTEESRENGEVVFPQQERRRDGGGQGLNALTEDARTSDRDAPTGGSAPENAEAPADNARPEGGEAPLGAIPPESGSGPENRTPPEMGGPPSNGGGQPFGGDRNPGGPPGDMPRR